MRKRTQPQLLWMNLGFFLAKRVSILAHNSNITTENFVLEMSSSFCFVFFKKSDLSEDSPCFPPSQARQNCWHSKLLYWTCFYSLSRPEPCMVYGNQWSIQTQRTSGLQYFLLAFSWLCSWKHIWVQKCGCACMSVLIYSKYKLFSERALFIERWKSTVLLRSLVQNLKLTLGAILD